MARVVLVTGVSRHLGSRMAAVLSNDPGIEKVIGVDIVPPREGIGGAEFVRADIRNPIIAKVIAAAGVDTVVHMGVLSTPVQAGGRVSMKEINVIGTMQLLAACQKSPGISRLIVKSTSSIYGAGPKDPAMFTEDTEPRSQPRSGWAKDSVEVESYVRGFARRRPDVAVTTFRFANFLGPKVDTPMAAYFGLPIVPTVLGHDARLQFIHEDDGLEVIRRAALDDHPGTFNVAGDGIIMLSQAVRLAGKSVLPVPTPMVGVVGGWFRRAGLADFSSEQIKFLTYGRGLDTTRLRERMGFVPTYTTHDAFAEFVHERGLDSALPKHRAEAIERGIAHALGSSTLSEARLSARLREEAPGRA
jgi:UDP-glucose 4-epimerase